MKTDSTRYLILGNSTAAVGAVEGIRKVDPDGGLVLVSREPYHTYSRPLISYLLAGEVDEERMHYRPLDFYERNNIDARLGVEAVCVDPTARAVELSDGNRIVFEKLLVATGGRPFVPSLEGGDADGVFTFTSWDDAKAIGEYVERHGPERALVVGGGLIGVKAA
jgi:NAD(P)H-nitrite reductase large subunit